MICTRSVSLLILSVAFLCAFDCDAAMSLRPVSKASLPADIGIARDVRWAGPSEVFISLGARGAVRTRVNAPVSLTTVMPPSGKGGFALSARVAVAHEHLVVASPFGGVGWIPLEGSTRTVREKALMIVTDIDARGDAVAILGADSGDVTGLARDGVIAWTGLLSKRLSDLRPLMKGRAKPGGKDMARCAFLETGAIRYMPDGSLVVMPGAEPGVYRYSAAGKLLQTWETEPLGIVDDCGIAQRDLEFLGSDFAARLDWLASRVVVDDIVPLPAGPALLLRSVSKGVTQWDLLLLSYRGKPERVRLPLTMPHPRGHVRGDVRGNQLVLLAFEDPLPGKKALAPAQLHVFSFAGR